MARLAGISARCAWRRPWMAWDGQMFPDYYEFRRRTGPCGDGASRR